jgi:phage baseplate assembly protein W
MTFELEYNSERSKMAIPEYGRHIQKLVDHCVKLEDREERNEMAQAIIEVMGNLQPHLRDIPDFKHKLWDQLFIISNYELDVDAPYKITSQVVLERKPEKLPYPKVSSKYRYYGHNMQTMIDIAISWEEGEMKDKLVRAIANHMKKCYLLWNKDNVTDEIIKNHLEDLSDQKLTINVDDESLMDAKKLTYVNTRTGNRKTKKKKTRK